MIHLLIRFLIVYFVTVFSMKIMGKRQIGELQTSELVTTFFLSELATCAVIDEKIPLLYGILPIMTLLALEVVISWFSLKIPFVKRRFDHTPSILIRKGKLDLEELRKNRLSIDEFISMLRQAGIADPSKARDAVLEPNGKISVFPYAKYEPSTRSDQGIQTQESGLSFAFVEDGIINERALTISGKNRDWLLSRLREGGFPPPDQLFLYAENENGDAFAVKKEKS